MAENNETNRHALASQVVEDMDLDDLLEVMTARLEQEYEHDDTLFQEDWENNQDMSDEEE